MVIENTLLKIFIDGCRKHPDEIALLGKNLQSQEDGEVTWSEWYRASKELAAGWVQAGLKSGEIVVMDLPHTVEWPIVHLSILMAGGVTLPLGGEGAQTSFSEPFLHCGARFVVTSWSRALCEFAKDYEPNKIGVECLYYLEGSLSDKRLQIPESWRRKSLRISTLREQGRSQLDLFPLSLKERMEKQTSDTLSMVLFTPGTEGRSRGVCLDSGNFLWEIKGVAQRLELSQESGLRQLIVMPNHTIWGLLALWLGIQAGHSMKLLPSMKVEPDSFSEWSIELLLGTPNTFQVLLDLTGHENIVRSLLAKRLSAWALDRLASKNNRSLMSRLPGEVASGVVRRQLKRVFGKESPRLVCVGMPPPSKLERIYRESGFCLYSGYGLTETSGFTHLNAWGNSSPETAGHPIDGVEARVSPDGEILVRGKTIFKGYWQDKAKTSSSFDEDGWFCTGDMGMEEEGGLVIIGRKDHIFEIESGHPVAPLPIEADLESKKGILYAIVLGEGKPFVTAIFELESRRENGDGKKTSKTPIKNEIRRFVDEINSKLPKQERIRKFEIVESVMPEGEESGALGRPKRDVVIRAHSRTIEKMYSAKSGAQ